MSTSIQKYPVIIFIFLGVFCFSACHDAFNECLSGSGDPTVEKRKMYPFRDLEVHDNLELKIVQSDEYAVIISAGNKIIPMINTRITYHRLLISNESTCPLLKDPWKPVKIEVRMPDLDSLFIKSQGEVRIPQAFDTENLYVRISESAAQISLNLDVWKFRIQNEIGTADVKVSGTCRDGFVYNNGYGVVDCLEVSSVFMIVNSNSTNQTYVRAGEKLLDAKITFTGNIYYQGTPDTIIRSILGSGQLLRLDQ